MILVTGGLGMIGAHTACALADLDREVLVTAHRRSEPPSLLRSRVEEGRIVVVPLDVTDRGALLALGDRYDIDDIVHLSGTIPDADPVAFFRLECAGLLNAVDAARAWGVHRFAVASSLGVYTGRPEIPWHEELELPTAPLPHPIVSFKKAAEPLVLEALRGSTVEPVVLRIGSIWGPLFDPYSPFTGIVTWISAVLRGEQPPPLHADGGGDACYAPDAGRAIALLVTAATLPHQIYNVSSGVPFTNRAFVDALNDALTAIPVGDGRRRLPEVLTGRGAGPGDIPYLDITRLENDTGFVPAFDLTAAVADYVTYRLSQPR